MEYSIVAETPDYLVVDKPSGISSHPSPGDTAPNLVDLLVDHQILAPIARLDRQASGLVVLAKTSDFARDCILKYKTYQALVLGKTEKSGTVDRALLTKGFDGEKREQDAKTTYRFIEGNDQYTLISVMIHTGRHHQIRRHLRSIGHPIIGDYRHGYSDRNNEIQERYGKPIRLCLHCCGITVNYNNKDVRYESVLPEDVVRLQEFLTQP
jgi:23S rRNA-/tRNA-specific pseudouridylate synthase